MQTLGCGIWDPVAGPGMEPGPPALGARSLTHWTTREEKSLPFSFKQRWGERERREEKSGFPLATQLPLSEDLLLQGRAGDTCLYGQDQLCWICPGHGQCRGPTVSSAPALCPCRRDLSVQDCSPSPRPRPQPATFSFSRTVTLSSLLAALKSPQSLFLNQQLCLSLEFICVEQFFPFILFFLNKSQIVGPCPL